MEQNKVLMIIVSVAIFFAAVVGVGVALLYPAADGAGASLAGTTTTTFDPIEYVRRPEAAPLEDTEERPAVIVYGDPNEDEESAPPIVLDTVASSEPEPVTERPARTTTERPQSEPSPVTAEPTATPPPATPVARRTTPDPTPREIRVTEYWIQLIASTSRDRVEQAGVLLEQYNLSGRITTREIDDSVFYRLRVGPYTSADEAGKFVEWLREIDEFGEAWVSEEYPLRTTTG